MSFVFAIFIYAYMQAPHTSKKEKQKRHCEPHWTSVANLKHSIHAKKSTHVTELEWATVIGNVQQFAGNVCC